MKQYIKPTTICIQICQDRNLLAGSQEIENGPNVYDTEHGGGDAWSRRGSIWDDEEE